MTRLRRVTAAAGGGQLFKVRAVSNERAAAELVRTREADLLVVSPAGFPARLEAFRADPSGAPPAITNRHDAARLRSTMAMAMSDCAAFLYATAVTRTPPPLAVDARPVDAAPNRGGTTR